MAGVTLGFLKYVLGLDTLAFRKGMTEAERDLVKLQKTFEKKGQQFQDLGKKLSVGLTLPLTAFAAKGIKEAQETAQAMAQVNAALASMGPVAGRSAAQLSKLADGLETQSLFEADQILQKVTANLLTFGNISGQAFDRAQQAAVDLSTRLGTDLQSSAIMVGKALNDPIKGMNALGRAGVQFSTDQKAAIKAMVETGNVAGAQAIILKELERQVGGAAAAAQNADPFNKLTDAFNQMAEKIGTALLPIIPPLTNAITGVLNAFSALPQPLQTTALVLAAVSAAAGPLLIGLGGLIKVVAGAPAVVTALAAAWTAMSTALAAARVAALATLPALTPFLVPIAAITAAVVAGYLAWKNWDKIKAIVQNMVTGVANALRSLAEPFKWVIDKAKQVGDAFFKLYDRVVGHSYVPDMVDGIAAEMQRLDAAMVQPAKKATADTSKSFENLSALLARLFPEAANKNAYMADLAELDRALKKGKLSAEQYKEALERLKVDKGQVTNDTVQLESRGNSGDPSVNFPGMAEALDRIPTAAEQANEALKGVALDGLRSLGDGLTAVIMGTAKLGDVFRTVAQQILADLIRIAIQKYIIGTIVKTLGLGGFSEGGLVKGYASGGFVSGKGTSTSDSIPALLSNGEFVMSAAATKRFLPMLKQMNSGALRLASGGLVNGKLAANDVRLSSNDRASAMKFEFHNDFRGADPSTMAAIEARQKRFEAEFQPRVVAAVRNAEDRFVLRRR